MASTTADEDPGNPRQRPLEAQDQDQARHADRQSCSHRVSVGKALNEPGCLVDQGVGVDRESEELWQLAHHDGQRQAVHVTELRRLGQEVGHEPELEDSGEQR